MGSDTEPQHPQCGAEEEGEERWFKQAQRWRTGCEGRISVLKRRTD